MIALGVEALRHPHRTQGEAFGCCVGKFRKSYNKVTKDIQSILILIEYSGETDKNEYGGTSNQARRVTTTPYLQPIHRLPPYTWLASPHKSLDTRHFSFIALVYMMKICPVISNAIQDGIKGKTKS